MKKKLTILFAFAIFVLVLGWAITPAQAHQCSRHNDKDHKHCNVDPPPPSGGDGVYEVTITGNVLGNGELWEDGTNKTIGLPFQPTYELNPLIFFGNKFNMNEAGQRGENCFPDAGNVPLSAASITSRNVKGMPVLQAIGRFWFFACADDGNANGECFTDVSYLLNMFGTFEDDANWPPSNMGDINFVTMTAWEMTTTSGTYRKIACRSEDFFTDDPPGQTILVERTN